MHNDLRPEVDGSISPGGPILGFVGLGHMGAPMAAQVAERFSLWLYDVDPDAGRGVPSLGRAQRAPSLATLAQAVDIVLLSLPAGPACRSVIAGLASAESPRVRCIVDLSTIGPTWATTCARDAQSHGWSYIDAPVSGGRRGALGGALSVMVSGDEQEIERVNPVLRALADKLFVIGTEPGLGQVMKLVNNAIALAVLPLTSEALAFGGAHGLDMGTMLEVINASSGRTQRSEGMFPTSIATRRFDHGATGEITEKDVALYLEEAESTGTSVDIGRVVGDVYKAFVQAHPLTDYSYLHEFVVKRCQVE